MKFEGLSFFLFFISNKFFKKFFFDDFYLKSFFFSFKNIKAGSFTATAGTSLGSFLSLKAQYSFLIVSNHIIPNFHLNSKKSPKKNFFFFKKKKGSLFLNLFKKRETDKL